VLEYRCNRRAHNYQGMQNHWCDSD